MTELKPCEYCGGLNFIMDCSRGAYNFLCTKCHALKIYPLCSNERLIFSISAVTNTDNTRQPAINWQPINEIEQYFNLGSDKFYRLLIEDANCNLYLGKDWERGYIFISGFFDDGVRVNLEHVKEKFTRFAEITPPNS